VAVIGTLTTGWPWIVSWAETVTGESCSGAEFETDARTSASAAAVVRDGIETLQPASTNSRQSASNDLRTT
jgi:hypothetical protein